MFFNKLIIFNLLFLVIILINLSNGFHTPAGGITKKLEMQQASFQLITASAYRNAQASREWCEDDKTVGGRSYSWNDYRGMVINFLDLYVALQFDPECDTQIGKLRTMFVDQAAQPTPYTKDSWWDNTFLPAAVDAFTCGFTGSKIDDFENFVSDDLLENFDTDIFKQKIYHMIGTYLGSIYKQRENANRRLDFDAGLYIPFLDKYTGGDYTTTQQMRVGFPTYLGRSLWNIFHILAQRISDSKCDEKPDTGSTNSVTSSSEVVSDTISVYTDLIHKFKNFMVYFPNNHPCPFCREHMISKVLVNDRYQTHDIYSSEAIRFFPIEHLLMGGTGGDLKSKISTVTADDKRSVAAFFWKLHNAVTSSVEQGCQCFTEEIEDKDPYHCEFNSNAPIQTRYPRQQRSYPFAKRFEFILTPNHNYTLFKETRKSFSDIVTQINKLDTIELRLELVKYWNDTTIKISDDSQSKINQLTTLIDQMTTEFLATPVLSQAYSYPLDSPLNCSKSVEFFSSLVKVDSVDAPNMELARTPELCISKMKPSSCEAQYYTPPPKEEIKETQSSSNNDASSLSSSKIIYALVIVLSLILLSI